ncbi:class C sortase [Enterococcus sp. 2201sp1_2201st1_B8_2201SCRN_220225]|uniref:class C sortase n=1 Tax=unclassified Enterococcus TaxID=2608891 RepID=UPI0034A3B813
MKEPEKKSKRKSGTKHGFHKRLIADIIMILVLIVGVVALFYPLVSDKLNEVVDQQIISYYQKKANQENEAAMEKIKAEQEARNKKIAEEGTNPGTDPFADERKEVEEKPTPDYYETHTIGVIRIPKIDVKLPIFDRTTEVFLNKGATLLEGTSYPTGGENTHSVISAHRGLPEAKLFTDLPELETGDHFYIEINNETLAYEVDQIKTIEPTETEDLQIVEGQDLITLMTCTPYMINTHRLLVRGHRIPYVPEMKNELNKSDKQRLLEQILILGGAVLVILALLTLIGFWLRGVLIHRRRYQLKFQLVDGNGQRISGVSFGIFTKNGKRPIYRNGQPLQAVTDDNGIFEIADLLGGKYLVKATQQELQLKAKVKKLKAPRFLLLLTKKSALVKGECNDYPIFVKYPQG